MGPCVTCAARTAVTDRATRTCAHARLSPCPTAPALSPTVLIHLHRCQASTAGKLGPQGRMGRIAGVRGWGRMAHGSLRARCLTGAAGPRPAGPRPSPRGPCPLDPAGQDFRPPESRPFNVPASPEQGAADVRPAASKGQICPAAGRHEVRWCPVVRNAGDRDRVAQSLCASATREHDRGHSDGGGAPPAGGRGQEGQEVRHHLSYNIRNNRWHWLIKSAWMNVYGSPHG